MYDLTVSAIRKNGVIQVTLNGFLANSCWEASITSTFPGTIEHDVDPGHAEVYIEENNDLIRLFAYSLWFLGRGPPIFLMMFIKR